MSAIYQVLNFILFEVDILEFLDEPIDLVGVQGELKNLVLDLFIFVVSDFFPFINLFNIMFV